MSMEKLKVSDIHKRYGDNVLLRGVSLTANAGDVISIIGSSGSGKSTFLRCMNFLEKPSEGSIYINGKEIRMVRDLDDQLKVVDHKQLQLLRTKLTMVFQHFNLWNHMTVLENVMAAPVQVLGISKEEAEARAVTYLEKVGIDELARKKYPSHLSGGQQQRVAMARALLNNPPLILADEPTGQLDSSTSQEILRLLMEINKLGKTIVVVTHDEETASWARRRIIMRDGLIVDDQVNHPGREASETEHAKP